MMEKSSSSVVSNPESLLDLLACPVIGDLDCELDRDDEFSLNREPNHSSPMEVRLPPSKKNCPSSLPPKFGNSTLYPWNEWDVPMGRAQDVHDFIGNVRYRTMVVNCQHLYNKTSNKRADKARICIQIYNEIKSNGGRFLDLRRSGIDDEAKEESCQQQEWFEVSKEKALAKIGQALRMAARRIQLGPPPAATSSCKSPAAKQCREDQFVVHSPTDRTMVVPLRLPSSERVQILHFDHSQIDPLRITSEPPTFLSQSQVRQESNKFLVMGGSGDVLLNCYSDDDLEPLPI